MTDIMKLANIYASRLHIDRMYGNEESSYDLNASRDNLQSAIEALQTENADLAFLADQYKAELDALKLEVEEVKSFWKEAMLRNRNMLDEVQTLRVQIKRISDNNIGQLIETSQNLGLYDK